MLVYCWHTVSHNREIVYAFGNMPCGRVLCPLGVQLEGQNFDFNAHSCTWIQNSQSTSKISARSSYACCGDATGCVIGEFKFEDTYPKKINTNR